MQFNIKLERKFVEKLNKMFNWYSNQTVKVELSVWFLKP